MNILITGAGGFLGQNLCKHLSAIIDDTNIDNIFQCHRDTPIEQLSMYCKHADFVFHFAGVNRVENVDTYHQNVHFTQLLVDQLQLHNNLAPIVYTSSVQATLPENCNPYYGSSKKMAEEVLISHHKKTNARIMIYRLPNVFGKWCKPNYNSVISTFCYNLARDLPISIHNPETILELLYVDDFIKEMMSVLKTFQQQTDIYYNAHCTYRKTLSEIVTLLRSFAQIYNAHNLPPIHANTFESKLCSTYVSYIPPHKLAFSLTSHSDDRGSFTELLRTDGSGQISLNRIKPGVTKGEHWHHSKCELFFVVSGRALIRQRKLGETEILSLVLDGSRPEAVWMLPGYTHNVINLSDTEDLVTVIWASEGFDPARPDTFFEVVEQ